MTSDHSSAGQRIPFFTRGTIILTVLAAAGLVGYVYRLLFGLQAATNLDSQYAWGLWIAVDVASGVALAAGGFTTAALADIFHKEAYHVFVRPALLTAMLGYTFVVIGLLADLGRYYNVWHPMLPSMWQGNSALFEVGMCVMIYLSVLYIEFLPIVVERFRGRVNLPGFLSKLNRFVESCLAAGGRYLGRFISLFILAGVVLSCLHQSSLGTLMLIAPGKMHPLWYTNILPVLFLLSAIAVGFPMVIFESILTSRSLKCKPETGALSSIAVYVPVLLGIYLAVKVADLTIRDATGYLFDGSAASLAYWLELLGGVVLPIVLLVHARIRRSVTGLFTAALLVVAGVVLNRINVFLVAYEPLYSQQSYFPSPIEITVTIGLISTLVLIFRWIVINFPILTTEECLKRVGVFAHRVRPTATEEIASWK
jgi:Ni/Fe-hydrogenase subunit HybB-like protein